MYNYLITYKIELLAYFVDFLKPLIIVRFLNVFLGLELNNPI